MLEDPVGTLIRVGTGLILFCALAFGVLLVSLS